MLVEKLLLANIGLLQNDATKRDNCYSLFSIINLIVLETTELSESDSTDLTLKITSASCRQANCERSR